MWVLLPGFRHLRQFRSPQQADGFAPTLAVLILVVSGVACSGADVRLPAKTASVGSDDAPFSLDTKKRTMRIMRQELRVHEASSLLRLNETSGQSPASNKGGAKVWNMFSDEEEDENAPPPSNIPLFSWDAGGGWAGTRRDLLGEYGFAFIPEQDMMITALGRHVDHTWKHQGLHQRAEVTLWRADKREKVRSVLIGNTDSLEIRGQYMFKYIDPIKVTAKKEYRLTQGCRPDDPDTWFDEIAKSSDVELYSAMEVCTVTMGVYSEVLGQYPAETEEQYRRVGMLNLRMDPILPREEQTPKPPPGTKSATYNSGRNMKSKASSSNNAAGVALMALATFFAGSP